MRHLFTAFFFLLCANQFNISQKGPLPNLGVEIAPPPLPEDLSLPKQTIVSPLIFKNKRTKRKVAVMHSNVGGPLGNVFQSPYGQNYNTQGYPRASRKTPSIGNPLNALGDAMSTPLTESHLTTSDDIMSNLNRLTIAQEYAPVPNLTTSKVMDETEAEQLKSSISSHKVKMNKIHETMNDLRQELLGLNSFIDAKSNTLDVKTEQLNRIANAYEIAKLAEQKKSK